MNSEERFLTLELKIATAERASTNAIHVIGQILHRVKMSNSCVALALLNWNDDQEASVEQLKEMLGHQKTIGELTEKLYSLYEIGDERR